MKQSESLFGLCRVVAGEKNPDTVSVTAISYFRDGKDKEARMEEQLLGVSEYILLRGKAMSTYRGILREVNVISALEMNRDAIRSLHQSLPQEYKKNAVFMLNSVTLHELYRMNGDGEEKLLRADNDGSFELLGVPVVLNNAMPCPGQGNMPILYGDFSKIRIEDCGRSELEQVPYRGNKDDLQCSMTAHLNCVLTDRQAVWGMKII